VNGAGNGHLTAFDLGTRELSWLTAGDGFEVMDIHGYRSGGGQLTGKVVITVTAGPDRRHLQMLTWPDVSGLSGNDFGEEILSQSVGMCSSSSKKLEHFASKDCGIYPWFCGFFHRKLTNGLFCAAAAPSCEQNPGGLPLRGKTYVIM
jgi:hypothetical protein